MGTVLPGGSRIAFFGGSFDPPHLGHIAVARAAQQALSLDRVLFAPVGLQPLKPSGPSASFDHRVAMTRLAIASHPGFEISLLDAPNPASAAPNYTIDTLTQLRQSLTEDARLYLLLGADSFRTLHHWRRANEIPFLASLIVASRPGEDLRYLSASLSSGLQLKALPNQPNQYLLINDAGEQAQLTILPDLNYDISATQLRLQIQDQLHGPVGSDPQLLNPHILDPLLDPQVLEYIREHRLYEQF
jgi:nicotinate-nucleotide adenylyltransferase